jgi:hypothetical protein
MELLYQLSYFGLCFATVSHFGKIFNYIPSSYVRLYAIDMEETYPSPWSYAQDLWRNSRIEFLVPIAAGAALSQFMLALFALRSYHSLFLLVCFIAVGFATLRTLTFLYQFSTDRAKGTSTPLSTREVQELFLPMLLSVVVYGIIAPNYLLGIIFALISLPHALSLLYIIKRHSTLPPAQPALPIASPVRALASRLAASAIRAFSRTPDFTTR